MSDINQIASGLYKVLTESEDRKPKPYDVKATVLRDDGNLVWVKIPGGVDETPVQKTNNANIGDDVMVRISGGRAWLLGNETSPATDNQVANAAVQLAEGADNLARTAASAAADAQQSATVAYAYAETAKREAGEAATAADEAKTSAGTAYNAATNALTQLGIVQDVVNVLNWISSHGTYKKSIDETIDENKFYFQATGSVIEDPSGNPSDQGYYELVNGVYILTTDVEVDPEKIYYNVTVTAVENPYGSPASNNYYELNDLKEGVSNYIHSHLALLDDGLWIQGDDVDGRALFSPSGIYLYDVSQGLIATFGSEIKLGNNNTYLKITPTVMQYFLEQKIMAIFGYSDIFESYGIEAENLFLRGAGNALRLDNAVNGTYQGQYILETRANGHLSLKPGLRRTEEEEESV